MKSFLKSGFLIFFFCLFGSSSFLQAFNINKSLIKYINQNNMIEKHPSLLGKNQIVKDDFGLVNYLAGIGYQSFIKYSKLSTLKLKKTKYDGLKKSFKLFFSKELDRLIFERKINLVCLRDRFSIDKCVNYVEVGQTEKSLFLGNVLIPSLLEAISSLPIKFKKLNISDNELVTIPNFRVNCNLSLSKIESLILRFNCLSETPGKLLVLKYSLGVSFQGLKTLDLCSNGFTLADNMKRNGESLNYNQVKINQVPSPEILAFKSLLDSEGIFVSVW